MKTVINETDGFRHLVEVRDCSRPSGYKQIRFTTEWDGARRDGSEQVQFEIILSNNQVEKFKQLL